MIKNRMKKNESFPNHSADHKKRQEKTPSVERVFKVSV